MSSRILIIEDDSGLSQMLCLHFEDQGMRAIGAENCDQGLRRVREEDFDLVLLDQQLPDGLGIDLLPRILAAKPKQTVIMMTGRHDLELAIEAIKIGAAEFVHKPIDSEALQRVVDKALNSRRLDEQARPAATADSNPGPTRELIGKSAAMLAVSKEIALSAQSNASVLITGESGTGKEVVARLLHQHSARAGLFVAVNCAAIVDTLLESELFGHEKGAFTGAVSRKKGKFELAEGGTLFLDEIGELAPGLQAKLLRALQERVFERVGGTEPISSDARVVAATNRDLFAEAQAGRYREDLIYRLNVVGIHLPPLRERREDIPLLARALLEKIAALTGKPGLSIHDGAMAKLREYAWPGNVRELENTLTQAAIHCRGTAITADLIDFKGAGAAIPTIEEATQPSAEQPWLRTLDQVEAEHVQRVLDFTGGHKGRTSQILGISRPALDRKIKKYQLKLPER